MQEVRGHELSEFPPSERTQLPPPCPRLRKAGSRSRFHRLLDPNLFQSEWRRCTADTGSNSLFGPLAAGEALPGSARSVWLGQPQRIRKLQNPPEPPEADRCRSPFSRSKDGVTT